MTILVSQTKNCYKMLKNTLSKLVKKTSTYIVFYFIIAVLTNSFTTIIFIVEVL